MTLWASIGYSGNPYAVEPLPPTSEGAGLLVGRDRDLRRLLTELRSTDTHPTIEGENGVGKTSLVYVAGFDAMKDYTDGNSDQLLIPIAPSLQISSDAESFEQEALYAVLRAYINSAPYLADHGFFVPELDDVRRWLTEPLIRGRGGGASVAGFGANANVTASPNTGAGYALSGLRGQVADWLRQTFPTRDDGAFIATIDNIELLQTSTEARRALERLRDGILAMPGVRWVLCGAKGIVRSAASSQRMSGRVGSPIELRPVASAEIPELIRRRLHHFAARPDPEVPVLAESFEHLYQVANENLRNAFKYAQDFVVWLEVEGHLLSSANDKAELLEVWMAETADAYEQAAGLQPAQWSLLDAIAAAGGSIAPGDHQAFGFNSSPAMRFHLQRLEQANMIDSTVDDTDHRRRTISITSVGWLVRYRRSGYQMRP